MGFGSKIRIIIKIIINWAEYFCGPKFFRMYVKNISFRKKFYGQVYLSNFMSRQLFLRVKLCPYFCNLHVSLNLFIPDHYKSLHLSTSLSIVCFWLLFSRRSWSDLVAETGPGIRIRDADPHPDFFVLV